MRPAAPPSGCIGQPPQTQKTHTHLIVEAPDRAALARAVQGVCVRLARRLNRRLGRKGKVFADRYHARVLKTPLEVRRASIPERRRRDRPHDPPRRSIYPRHLEVGAAEAGARLERFLADRLPGLGRRGADGARTLT